MYSYDLITLNMKQLFYLCTLVALLCATACQAEKEPKPKPTAVLEVSVDSLVFDNAGNQALEFNIKASDRWYINKPVDGDWCILSKTGGTGDATITVTVKPDAPEYRRTTRLSISDFNNNTVYVNIVQSHLRYLTISSDTVSINSLEHALPLIVDYSQGEYTAESDCDWIIVSPLGRAKDERTIKVNANTTAAVDKPAQARVGHVTFKRTDTDIKQVLLIKQQGFSERDVVLAITAAMTKRPPLGLDEPDVSLSEMQGVKLDEDGNVSELEFYGPSFVGQIPWEFSLLPHLQILKFVETNFSGDLPSTFANLTNLRTFMILKNGQSLSKDFLNPMFKIPNLEILDIRDTPIANDILANIANCANLVELRLDGTSLTGKIPTQIESLKNLVTIDLRDNRLEGVIPDELFLLPSIQQIYLRSNQLEGAIPVAIGSCVSLKKLDLANNKLVGSIPEELCNLTKLETIWLESNTLNGELPSNIGNLKTLGHLVIMDNMFTGSLPESMAGMVELSGFWAARNQLSGTIPESVKKHPNYKDWTNSKVTSADPQPMNLCNQIGTGFSNCD